MLVSAIVLITSALGFYTAGVWAEHRAEVLSVRHALLFAAGLTFDSSGTYVMSRIAEADPTTTAGAMNAIMMLTGGLALVLMAAHLAWAVVVLVRNRLSEKIVFHRFSLVVWAIWLVPYVTGVIGSR